MPEIKLMKVSSSLIFIYKFSYLNTQLFNLATIVSDDPPNKILEKFFPNNNDNNLGIRIINCLIFLGGVPRKPILVDDSIISYPQLLKVSLAVYILK